MKSIALCLAVLCAGCGAGAPASSEPTVPPAAVATTRSIDGARTFVVIPELSGATYHASEEFFAGAMKLLGIEPGRVVAVGSTQAIEGKFLLDGTGPVPILGDNAFSVRLNTLTSNQRKRDDYLREVRDDGPSFDAYPLATFRGVSITPQPPRGDRDEMNYQLTGDLTIRNITRRINFDVNGRADGDRLIGEANTDILLSDYGIGPIAFGDILAVADRIRLEIMITARAQP